MIQIKNLTLTNKLTLNNLIENFSITLNKGDKVAIIGEEGNGKSSLLKWLVNPNWIEDYLLSHGEIIRQNETFSYLPQELDKKDLEKSIYEFFYDEDFFNNDFNALSKLAIDFGLPNDIYYSDQKMKYLSGGEKIKLQLMKILLSNSSVLLLDEPSNDIDISTLKLLENIINTFEGIVIFISHDEVLLENTANVIVHIEQLKRKTESRITVAKLDYQSYIKQRFQRLEKAEQIATNQESEKKKRDQKYSQIYQNVQNALNNVPGNDASEGRLLKKKMHAVKSMGKRFAKMDENMTQHPEIESAINLKLDPKISGIDKNKIILESHIKELKVADILLIKDVDLFIKGNVHLGIIGKNGAGKSTLLKEILRLVKDRNDIKVGYMPQNYSDIIDMNLDPVTLLSKDSKKETITKTRTFLGALKFTAEEMNHSINELSGGQKTKILLLKLLLDECNVLILDEPTRNFSPLSNPIIRETLKKFPGTIISISHDRKYLKEVCEDIYLLKECKLKKLTEQEYDKLANN